MLCMLFEYTTTRKCVHVLTAVRGIWHIQSWCKYLHMCGCMYAALFLHVTAVIVIVYSFCCVEFMEKDKQICSLQ